MSDISQGPGWWLASDGRWYPPTEAPGPPSAGTSLDPIAQPVPPFNQPPSYGTPPPTAFGVNPVIYRQQVPGVPAKKNRKGTLIAVIAVIAVAVVAVAAVLVLNKPSNTATGSATGLPPNTTLQAFQSNLEDQLKAPEPGGFAVTGISSVVCNMPHVWDVGNTFTCFVYDKSGSEMGTVAGTVLTTQPGGVGWNANLNWKPSPSYSGNTGSGNTGSGNTG